jgi:hypothetical protein
MSLKLVLLLFCSQSSYISYVEGFLLAPGEIDLSQLQFRTEGDATVAAADDDDGEIGDTTEPNADDDQDPEGNGGNRRARNLNDESGHTDDDNLALPGTELDIAVFHLVSNVARNYNPRDSWLQLSCLMKLSIHVLAGQLLQHTSGMRLARSWSRHSQ